MSPEEVEKMKRQLAVLGSLEQDGADIGGRSLDSVPDEPEVIAPPPSRVPMRPRVVDVDVSPRPDSELMAARGGDVDAFNDRATETALRQIVAGITRTRAPDAISQVTTGEKDLMARRRQAQLDALRQMEAGNNAARTGAIVKGNEEASARAAAGGVRADRKLALEETEADRRDARSTAERALREADLERKKAADAAKAKKGSGKASDAGFAPKGFPAGWELVGKTRPTSKQGEDFEKLVFSDAKMRGLTSQMKDLLKNGSLARIVPGTAEYARVKQLATEIKIEGKNIAELGALSGPDTALMEAISGDPSAIRSMAQDLPGLLDGLSNWGANSVKAKSVSLGARKTGSAGQAPESPSGKIVVSNGKERREIDADDEADAAKDGFKRVGQ